MGEMLTRSHSGPLALACMGSQQRVRFAPNTAPLDAPSVTQVITFKEELEPVCRALRQSLGQGVAGVLAHAHLRNP